MNNDGLFFLAVALDLAFVVFSSRLGKNWLFLSIVLNLLMVSTFGSKLVNRFGMVTNIGNVFYAAVFFGTQLLAQYYGKLSATRSVWMGAYAVGFFLIASQIVVLTVGVPETQKVSEAIDVLFRAAPRVAVASVTAYVVSQFVNINLFSYLSEKLGQKQVFLRVNLSNLIGQMVDSLIFFTVAFYGTISASVFTQTLLAGYIIKVGIGFLSSLVFKLGKSPTT